VAECVHLGGVNVVLQRVYEEVANRLPGVPHTLCLLQSPRQLLHGCLDLQKALQRPLHVPASFVEITVSIQAKTGL
ncbi:hypothetical protein GOODEAATRI_031648, partial [Goodea atripinnis]